MLFWHRTFPGPVQRERMRKRRAVHLVLWCASWCQAKEPVQMPTEQLQECEVAMLAQISHIYRSQLTVNPDDDAMSLAPMYQCQGISVHIDRHTHTNAHSYSHTLFLMAHYLSCQYLPISDVRETSNRECQQI